MCLIVKFITYDRFNLKSLGLGDFFLNNLFDGLSFVFDFTRQVPDRLIGRYREDICAEGLHILLDHHFATKSRVELLFIVAECMPFIDFEGNRVVIVVFRESHGCVPLDFMEVGEARWEGMLFDARHLLGSKLPS